MTDLTKRLTAVEADYLAECEDRIERGLQTFVEVGTALAMIRDNKLYRAKYTTFALYCEMRWGFTDRRARQIIEAAEIGSMFPVENSRQAGELARVPEAERVEVWQKANESTGGKPTAAAIRDAHAASRPSQPSATAEADGQLDAPGLDASGSHQADGGATPEAADSSVEDSGEPSTDGEEEQRVPALQPDSSDAAGAPAHFPAAGAPDPVDLVNKVLDALVPDDNPHREWQRRFLADVGAVHRLLRHDVDVVAAQADSQCIEEMGRIFAQLDEYRSKVLAALKASTPDNVTPLRRSS